MEWILLINVKMSIDGILTIISMVNTTSESLKARKVYIFSLLVLVVVEISCSVKMSRKKSFKKQHGH